MAYLKAWVKRSVPLGLSDLVFIVSTREGCLSPKPYNTSLKENISLPHDFIQLFSSFDSPDLDIGFSLFESL